MQIRFGCPKETCVALIELEPLENAGDSIQCPRCHTKHALHLTDEINKHQRVEACPLCGCRELFVRKDFPQWLGLLVVVVAGGISIATFRSNIWLSWGALASAMVVDLFLYLLVGKVTVCYACRAEFRRSTPNPEHKGFDLAQADKY